MSKVQDYMKTYLDEDVRLGNYAYFMDLFGQTRPRDYVYSYEELRGLRSRYHGEDAVIVDGQKGGFASAIIQCGLCKGVKDAKINAVPQASQATAEQRALIAKASAERPWLHTADLSAGYYQCKLHSHQDPLKLLTCRIQGRVFQFGISPRSWRT
eukprot:GHVH01014095.1.p1 GENE.GHVH01014095.1~~GHVH01014095.1.p1  ORF type:complete len:155 (+),score=13.67 GHVH01014095.1:914-1378(+)